jgi:hypothetical protein
MKVNQFQITGIYRTKSFRNLINFSIHTRRINYALIIEEFKTEESIFQVVYINNTDKRTPGWKIPWRGTQIGRMTFTGDSQRQDTEPY